MRSGQLLKQSFKNDQPSSPVTLQPTSLVWTSLPLEFVTLFFSDYFHFVSSVLLGAC